MATIALGFNISASATGMAQGVNAAAVELEKLGYAAKKTAADVGVLKTLSIGRAFVDGIRTIGTTFASFASGIDQSVESTSNLARELGVGYEQLSQLQLAAQLSGVSAETLAKAFTKAQVTITKAAAGGKEAVQALAEIGLSASDFQGLSSTQQFELIAKAISAITDPARRAAAAVAIFGRSGAELLPAFRELGSNLQIAQENFAKFQGGVTQVEADAVLSIGDAFTVIAKDIEIVATKVLAKLAPALTEASNQFVTFLASLDITAVANAAAAVIEKTASFLVGLGQAAVAAGEVLAPIVDFLSFVLSNAKGAAAGFVAVSVGLKLYASRAALAALATGGLTTAIRALLASTGIGLLVTLVGTLAGVAIEWGFKTAMAGEQAKASIDSTTDAAAKGASAAEQFGNRVARAQANAFGAAEDAASKAAAEAKRAADAARREADAAIQRVTVEQQFGGDSQRYAAAQAVEAIQADIKRTEEEIAAARAAGDQEALDAATRRLGLLDQALAREQDIASGARKAAAERLKLEADYAKAREAFDERRLAALARPSTELLQLEDTRTASGYAALQRFSMDQEDDPALQEYRKQLKELQKIRAELAKLDGGAATVDIIGG